MSNTVAASINASTQKTHEWIASVEHELHDPNPQAAFHALRSVLHALRDRLPAVEAAHLAAGLPTHLRGVYYEGWSPSNKPEKLTKQQFLHRIESEQAGPSNLNPLRCATAVFAVLHQHVGSGEIGDIRDILPKEIAELWPKS